MFWICFCMGWPVTFVLAFFPPVIQYLSNLLTVHACSIGFHSHTKKTIALPYNLSKVNNDTSALGECSLCKQNFEDALTRSGGQNNHSWKANERCERHWSTRWNRAILSQLASLSVPKLTPQDFFDNRPIILVLQKQPCWCSGPKLIPQDFFQHTHHASTTETAREYITNEDRLW